MKRSLLTLAALAVLSTGAMAQQPDSDYWLTQAAVPFAHTSLCYPMKVTQSGMVRYLKQKFGAKYRFTAEEMARFGQDINDDRASTESFFFNPNSPMKGQGQE